MGWNIGEGLIEATLIGDAPLPPYVIAHFDGLCEPRNPGGVATVAWAILGDDKQVLREFYGVLADGGPRATNNWAEYVSLGKLLRYLLETNFAGTVLILGDSNLVVNQVNGGWQVSAAHLIPLVTRCQSLIDELRFKGRRVMLNWVPREENEAADSLSERAFLEYVREAKPRYEAQYRRNKEARAKAKKKDK